VSEVTRGSQPQPSLYDVLQVSPAAHPAVIRAAYQALSRAYHSAANSPPSAGRLMREVKAAYDVLSDPDRRAQYDAERTRSAHVGRSERTVSTRANRRLDGDPNPPIGDRSVAAPPRPQVAPG
jgi:DnaJ-class molecular chaperone